MGSFALMEYLTCWKCVIFHAFTASCLPSVSWCLLGQLVRAWLFWFCVDVDDAGEHKRLFSVITNFSHRCLPTIAKKDMSIKTFGGARYTKYLYIKVNSGLHVYRNQGTCIYAFINEISYPSYKVRIIITRK